MKFLRDTRSLAIGKASTEGMCVGVSCGGEIRSTMAHKKTLEERQKSLIETIRARQTHSQENLR
jgi:hypothetical protein